MHRSLYGLAVLLILLPWVTLALLAVLVLPGVARRRAAARACARAFLRTSGLRLRVHGLEHLPEGQCIVVANHASYLDGLVMTAALPPRFAYVVKREADGFPLAGFLLRRLGTEFVERFNRHKGASDARRVLRTASGGQSMVFFPEGTFHPEPGLLKFHTGAFATAARAGCAVVPAAIRGTRGILPCSRLLPHPGTIDVELLEPLRSTQSMLDHATTDLRDRARHAILRVVEEPDAAHR